MKKLLGMCAVAAMLASFSMPASASYVSTSWEDYVTVNQDAADGTNFFSEFLDNISWNHSFTDNGYSPLIDLLTNGWIEITLSYWGSSDLASVRFGLLGTGGGGSFSGSPDSFGLNALGLGQLWLTGQIGVDLEPVQGSFHVVGSLAHLDGYDWVDGHEVAVPEPGSLALLAIGLIAMGAALSRRRNQKLK